MNDNKLYKEIEQIVDDGYKDSAERLYSLQCDVAVAFAEWYENAERKLKFDPKNLFDYFITNIYKH